MLKKKFTCLPPPPPFPPPPPNPPAMPAEATQNADARTFFSTNHRVKHFNKIHNRCIRKFIFEMKSKPTSRVFMMKI